MFKVVLSDAAKHDLRKNVQWWGKNRSEAQAERWYDAIMESVYSLEHKPERCLLAREAETLGIELRNLWFGLSSKQTHRILYIVENDVVKVLRVLSTRQDTEGLKFDDER